MTSTLLCFATAALAAPQAGPPSAAADGYSYRPSTGDAGAPALDFPADFHRRHVSAVVLRAGAYGGVGTAEPRCEGASCASTGEGEGFDHHTALALSVDWLFATSRSFRLGMGFMGLPGATTQLDGAQYELGTIVAADLVLEGVIDVSRKTALTLRGSAGLSVLFPGGELERDAEKLSALCDQAGSCTVKTGPYPGVQGALGAGMLHDLGRIGARVDFQVQAFMHRTLEMEGDGATSWLSFNGYRPMLLAGIEL